MNGIGGRTIAEAKEALTVEEQWQWVRYRNKRGLFHQSRRLELRLAQMEMLMRQFMGDKQTELYDLLPFEDQPQQVGESATFEQFAAILQSTVRH